MFLELWDIFVLLEDHNFISAKDSFDFFLAFLDIFVNFGDCFYKTTQYNNIVLMKRIQVSDDLLFLHSQCTTKVVKLLGYQCLFARVSIICLINRPLELVFIFVHVVLGCSNLADDIDEL